VTEVNSIGHNWNFGPEFAGAFHIDIERQFGGVRRAASILVQETHLRVGASDRMAGDRERYLTAGT
jgi:hypothetical protein